VEAIREQLLKYAGKDEEGTYFLNFQRWDNQNAVRDLIGEAMRRTSQEVVKVDSAAMPAIARSPIGKIASVFYGYGYGITNNVIAPLFAEGKLGRFGVLLLGSWGFGVANELIRGHLNDKPYDLDKEEDIKTLLDRSIRRIDAGLLMYAAERVYDFIDGSSA
jgi:hypothetical protein